MPRWKIDGALDLPIAVIEDTETGYGIAEIGNGERTRRNIEIAREIVRSHNKLFELKRAKRRKG